MSNPLLEAIIDGQIVNQLISHNPFAAVLELGPNAAELLQPFAASPTIDIQTVSNIDPSNPWQNAYVWRTRSDTPIDTKTIEVIQFEKSIYDQGNLPVGIYHDLTRGLSFRGLMPHVGRSLRAAKRYSDLAWDKGLVFAFAPPGNGWVNDLPDDDKTVVMNIAPRPGASSTTTPSTASVSSNPLITVVGVSLLALLAWRVLA